MHTPHLIAFKENTLFLGNAEPFFDSLLLFWVGDGIFVKDVAPVFHAGVAVLFKCFLKFRQCRRGCLGVVSFGFVLEIFWWFWWILVVLYTTFGELVQISDYAKVK